MTFVESILSLGRKNDPSQDEDLRRQLEASTVRMTGTLQEVESVKRERDKAQDVLKSKEEELKEACERYEKQIRKLQMERDSMTATVDHLQQTADGLQDERARLRSHNHKLYQQLLDLKDECLRSMNRQTEMSHLLETRTSELKGAQTFLTTADSHSGNEVIGMVERLNTEILQTAAFMADSFVVDYIGESQFASEDMIELLEWAKCLFGSKMVWLLRSSDHNEDPTLIQTALQAVMVNWSCEVISSWCFSVSDLQIHLRIIQESVQLAGEYFYTSSDVVS
jgi:hypothetical protein